MKNAILLLIGAITLLFSSACTTRLGEYTIISTKNVDTSAMSRYEKGHSRIRGEDKASIIVFVQMGQPNMKEAIDNAIEGTPGAVALLDPVLYHEYWWIPFIYGESKFVVEGNPLLKPSMSGRRLNGRKESVRPPGSKTNWSDSMMRESFYERKQ